MTPPLVETPLPRPAIIGMVHVGALPGSPANTTSVEIIAGQAAEEARVLADVGFDAIILENMHDAPYVHDTEHGPEVVAAMTRIVLEVEAEVGEVRPLPLGVQILSGGNKHAIAVAQSAQASFIRAENFVFSHVADEGLLVRAEAGSLLRYRKSIGADDVAVFTDIKKKHASHAITADVSLEEVAEAALFFGADGLIVTGTATGKPTNADDVRRVRSVVDASGREARVLVGSGVTDQTAPALLEHADALIVGSFIKEDGAWHNAVDAARCAALVKAAKP